jgi:Holin of 3TMs, for gene-transfer release
MSFDPLSALFELGKTAVEKIWPDPSKRAEELFKLEKLKQDGNLAELSAQVNLMLGQIKVNEVQASHPSIFVAGARPAVMWIGAFGLAYASILDPLMRFVAAVIFDYSGSFPVVNTDITMQVLFGILGLGAYRTFEKTKDVQTDRTSK